MYRLLEQIMNKRIEILKKQEENAEFGGGMQLNDLLILRGKIMAYENVLRDIDKLMGQEINELVEFIQKEEIKRDNPKNIDYKTGLIEVYRAYHNGKHDAFQELLKKRQEEVLDKIVEKSQEMGLYELYDFPKQEIDELLKIIDILEQRINIRKPNVILADIQDNKELLPEIKKHFINKGYTVTEPEQYLLRISH